MSHLLSRGQKAFSAEKYIDLKTLEINSQRGVDCDNKVFVHNSERQAEFRHVKLSSIQQIGLSVAQTFNN